MARSQNRNFFGRFFSSYWLFWWLPSHSIGVLSVLVIRPFPPCSSPNALSILAVFDFLLMQSLALDAFRCSFWSCIFSVFQIWSPIFIQFNIFSSFCNKIKQWSTKNNKENTGVRLDAYAYYLVLRLLTWALKQIVKLCVGMELEINWKFETILLLLLLLLMYRSI